ncbi:hypothetical protein NY486_19775, partial [Enterobacter hormaechei]|nr:hypothetical protein [Enterobacter hormaechei]
RNGVASFDHAMNMVERLQKIGTFKSYTHDKPVSLSYSTQSPEGPAALFLARGRSSPKVKQIGRKSP